MKFSIQRDEIYTALQKVVSVIPSRSTISMTQNVLFRAEGEQVELVTTDLEITMVSHVRAKIESEGSLAIPGRLIHDMIRELPNGIELTFESDSNYRLQVFSDFGKYKIGSENPAEFPQKPELTDAREILIPNESLSRLFTKTVFACSTDELRPALTGVFCELGNEKFRAVATDGHRLAMLNYSDDNLPQDGLNAIISTRAINFVLRSLPNEGMSAMNLGDKHALFNMDNTRLYARLIEESYVDYNRVIPPEINFEMKIDTSDFLSSVRRVSLFSNPITAQVVLKITPAQVTIQAEDMDYGGEAIEQIACEFNGEEFTIGFNSKYLQDILKHVDSPQVTLQMVRPDFAVLARPGDGAENEEQLMLLMPIRLENV